MILKYSNTQILKYSKMIPVVAQDENLKIVLWHFKRRNYSKRLARF